VNWPFLFYGLEKSRRAQGASPGGGGSILPGSQFSLREINGPLFLKGGGAAMKGGGRRKSFFTSKKLNL